MNKKLAIAFLIITAFVAGYFFNDLISKPNNPIQCFSNAIQSFFVNRVSDQSSQSPQKLTVGIQNSPSNALIIIASKKNLFDAKKVTVDIKEFSAGKLALQALLGQSGDLDVSVSAETPIALSSLGGSKLKVITQIVNAKNETRVVVRKEDGLDTPEKYFSKPRKLTTSQGGSPEWFTYNSSFLLYNATLRSIF